MSSTEPPAGLRAIPMSLEGKVAVVSGAARRIGREIALACARAGADVLVHYRRSAADADGVVAEIVALGRRAVALQADLRVATEARALVDGAAELGAIDLLVNSAGVFRRCELQDPDEARFDDCWRESFETNVLAPARLARYAASQIQARSGTIVNILDAAAPIAWPGYAHYVAAKAALASLTQTLAAELAPRARVVGIAPGLALFPEGLAPARRQHFVAQTVLQREGSARDIAEAVIFAACQGYLTGTTITIDGGLALRPLR